MSQPTRRAFLEQSTAALAASIFAGRSVADEPTGEWRNRQPGMEYRRLGRTGFQVSEIVMGGNEIAPDNYEHVLRALDLGLNYLDTSPAYGKGKSEEGYAKVLKARSRDQFFLTSKVSLWDEDRDARYRAIFDELDASEQDRLRRVAADAIERSGVARPDYLVNYFNAQRTELDAATLANVMEPKYGDRVDRDKTYKRIIFESVEGGLKRLGTDHLDILMCPHGASSPHELTKYPEIGEAFDRLKQSGKVRHLGVSAHTDPAGVLAAALDMKIYSVAMIAYNIVNHAYVDETLARAHAEDFGVIAMKVARPIHPGRGREGDPARVKLLNDAVDGDWSVPQKAYLWALRNPNLSAAIANMVDADQVEADLALPRSLKRA